MAKVLSAIQPSGDLHLGNYLGAVRQWVTSQEENDSYFFIVDLHALTLDIAPETLRSNTVKTAASLLASGLDPTKCTLFVQSHVPQHTGLTWLLECTASYGELLRMTQFKDKGKGQDSVRSGLLTYPVLMAADILLYDINFVPVGDDQKQHLELTRNLAIRFNNRYGDTFVIPEAKVPEVGARIMDLQNPTNKMSKSTATPLGTIGVMDDPSDIEKKIKKAVTDSSMLITYDRENHPGVTNLLEILSAVTDMNPLQLAEKFANYGELKKATTEAVIEALRPIRNRYYEILEEKDTLRDILKEGSEKASSVAEVTLAKARSAMGLL
ncbi:MAG: tryptophan--tRNA ligase [Firmicutes bacterium]|jgi:tryptophanyl-tRNA synthetase|nr:tryptophan--tRNA ligase [Bacillota bacterium]